MTINSQKIPRLVIASALASGLVSFGVAASAQTTAATAAATSAADATNVSMSTTTDAKTRQQQLDEANADALARSFLSSVPATSNDNLSGVAASTTFRAWCSPFYCRLRAEG